MQFKLAFFTAALATLAAATPAPGGGSGGSGSDCSTGPVQCCLSTTTVANASEDLLAQLGGLGVVVGDITGLIGVGCVAVVGGTCSAQSVCCTNNAVGSLISIGCVPIQL